MSKKRLYKFIILSLVALNIIITVFFLSELKHQNKPSNNIRSEVAEILHLDNEQISLFNELADEHKQQMKELDEHQGKLLRTYFESLSDSSINIQKDNLLNQMQLSERKKIELTYQHFKKIKKLLKEEQMPQFKKFTNKITQKLIKN